MEISLLLLETNYTKKQMRIITLTLVIVFAILGCSKKKEKPIFYKYDKSFLEKETIKKLNKILSDSLSTTYYARDKSFVIADLTNDSLPDTFAFLNFFNKNDNSFVKTNVYFYENTGKSLRLRKALSFEEYIYPSKKENAERTVFYSISTYEIKPDTYGRLDQSKKPKRGSLSIDDGELSYGIILGTTNYEDANSYGVYSEDYYKYVTAENGLIYRESPDGEAIGKFPYGTQVHVTGSTGLRKTIYDDGDVSGEWVEVFIEETNESVFVFDGYLGESHDIVYHKKVLASPVVFEEKNKKGIILKGSHLTYNKSLNTTGRIKVEEISNVEILSETENKRPQNNKDEYCKWSNYVKIKYNGEQIIVFGNKLLSISSTTEIEWKNSVINLVEAQDYTVGAADYDGLTFCDDYSYVFIEQEGAYSYINNRNDKKDLGKVVFVHDDGMSEEISSFNVKNDTIVFDIKQGFQEGSGSYKLNVFYEEGIWKSIETNHDRRYP